MSRSTTALKRLGVPGLAAVTMVAGLPLFLGTASAAHISGLNLTPETTNEAAGVCVPFTAQLVFSPNQTPRAETIDVVLAEGANSPAAQDVTFCTAPTNGQTPAAPQGATADGNTDHAEFTTDATGKVTFGIVSTTASTVPVTIRAFYEVDGSPNNNNRFDAGEFTDTSTATFTAGGAAGSNANQDAARQVEVVRQGEITSSTSTATIDDDVDRDNVVEGETRSYSVAVRGANGERLAGVTVSFTVDSNDNTADRGPATFGVTNNDGIATGTITFPTRARTGDTTDTVLFFVNQTGGTTNGPDPTPLPNGEPRDELIVTVREDVGQANRSVTLTPERQTFTGTQRSATFTAVVDDPRTTGADASTAGTLLTFGVTGGSGDETVSVSNPTPGGGTNECTTQDNTTTQSPNTNDSFCTVTVNDPTPTTGQVLTITATVRGSNGEADTSTLTFVNQPGDARFVSLTPETVTVAPNTAQRLEARVTDVDGNPVANVTVFFSEEGAGAFRNGSSSTQGTTNAQGIASVEVISLPGETGTATVTATISRENTQCEELANQGTDPQGNQLNSTNNTGAAGVCSDSSTVTFGAASPSPSPSATGTPGSPTATPSPSATNASPPAVACGPAFIRLIDTTIIATGAARGEVRGTPNSVVLLRAYTRPSTTFFTARRIEVGADGVGTFLITPPANTRMFSVQEGCTDTSEQVVLNVRTQLSLNVERLGERTYRFFGSAIPARPNGLIVSLYRVTNDGRQILTSQVRANANRGQAGFDPSRPAGSYSITRKFTGTGRFGFVVRTGQDLQNAPGSSNVRSLLIF